MRIAHFLAKPLPGKISVLVRAGVLILGLLVLSPLLLFSRTAHIASASSSVLHPFTITSPDFRDGGPLPQKTEFNKSSCTGSNIAPKLSWTNVPAGTKSFVMLMSDYDAPVADGFHHWIVYNIPASARALDGKHTFTEGTNSNGFIGYGGPCPPPTGETHHYLFLLYATDIAQIAGKGLGFGDVMHTVTDHVLSATSIIGTFKLPR